MMRKIISHRGIFVSAVFFCGICSLNNIVTKNSWVPEYDVTPLKDHFHETDDIKTTSKTSFAASRHKRMTMYQERYKYQPPQPYTNHTARDELCGASPDYTDILTRYQQIRSANDEDKIIYEIFFKEDTNNGISPVKGSVVEMGAYNGLEESNSHFYDICLGWDTLLVEGNALLWEKLVANRPRAHRFSYAPSCSEEDEIVNKTVKFDKYPMTNGGLADGSVTTTYTSRNNTIDVPCGSLTNVLVDILGGHVSFFSLDVEGAEPYVVGNLDFDRVFIEIMMIETYNLHCPMDQPCKSRDEFRRVMQEAGYIMFENMVHKSDVFIHPLSKHLNTAEKKGYSPTIWT